MRHSIRAGNPRGGLSIVEILVVLLIIAVITSLSLPNMHQARIESNRIATLHNMAMLSEAHGMYFHGHRAYPSSLQGLYDMKLLEDPRFQQARHGVGPPLDGYYYYFNCRDPLTGFLIFATPAEHGKSGVMSYCSGEMAVIFERDLGLRPLEDLAQEFEGGDYRIPPMNKLMEIYPNGRSMILRGRADDVWTQSRVAFE